ncbi:AbrB/MazE/SpoVT family DNA-binding domain-containing protein [Bacillus sp. RO3]|nr:AbrB/MazE/SpoVT family DNA-binding domain-containing protein [Bacillus sp. RO3]
MKSTGVVRKVDELGRVVIPIELRRNLGIAEKDPVEIFINGDQIILKKFKLSHQVESAVNYLEMQLNDATSEEDKEAIINALSLVKHS